LITGVVNRGELAILAAAPGTGKTPVVSQMALTTATGAPFLDQPTSACRVLQVDVESQAEDHRTLQRRQCEALSLDINRVGQAVDLFGRGVPKDPNSGELERILRCPNVTRLKWLMNLVNQGDYGLVIVDTALTFTPFKAHDENEVRLMYAALSAITHSKSRPAALISLHLRKRDRKAQLPTLLEDPMGWTEEILGSVVWSANADVRLGLERVGDDRVAFGGYRRGRGPIEPLVLELRRNESGDPLVWDRGGDDAVALHMLTNDQRSYFARIPIGQDLTWKALQQATGAADSTLSRLKEAAMRAGLLDYDSGHHVYRRRR
jgi:hypothetical protein